MKLTDKQRIDFVQRHRIGLTHFNCEYCKPFPWKISIRLKQKGNEWVAFYGRTWRQAVDKAIRAYQK